MSGLDQATAWLSTHQKPAAIGGGAIGVAALALYRKRKAKAAAASGTGTGATTTGNAVASTNPDGTQTVLGAGMDTTDLQNWVQDQLNSQTSQISAQYNQLANSISTSTGSTTGTGSTAVATQGTATDPNAAGYANEVAGVSAVLKNFYAHSPTVYAKQIEGANQVLSALQPGNSLAQNQAIAQSYIDNYTKHNATGLYTGQIEGAKQALQHLSTGG